MVKNTNQVKSSIITEKNIIHHQHTIHMVYN